MELRVLRYFLAVVKEQGISRAANALHVTQPTLSRQIMDLEEELGARLLDRSRRGGGVTLTDAGVRFFNRAEEIVALADMTAAEFKEGDDLEGGDIYVGAGESMVVGLVAKAAEAMRASRPAFRFHLFSGNALLLLERLERGLLDFAVVIGSVNVEKYNALPLPHADRVGVLMRKDSPLASKRRVTADDVRGLPLFVPQYNSGDASVNALMGKSGSQPPNIVGTYNLLYNASVMVAQGLGNALCIELDMNMGGQSQLTFRPWEPRCETRWNMVWRKDADMSRAARAFVDEMRNVCGAVGATTSPAR